MYILLLYTMSFYYHSAEYSYIKTYNIMSKLLKKQLP